MNTAAEEFFAKVDEHMKQNKKSWQDSWTSCKSLFPALANAMDKTSLANAMVQAPAGTQVSQDGRLIHDKKASGEELLSLGLPVDAPPAVALLFRKVAGLTPSDEIASSVLVALIRQRQFGMKIQDAYDSALKDMQNSFPDLAKKLNQTAV